MRNNEMGFKKKPPARLKIVSSIIATLFIWGCANTPPQNKENDPPSPKSFSERIVAETNYLDVAQDDLQNRLAKESPKQIQVEPVLPIYDPLEERMVSFSIVDEDFQIVLYSLSKAVGMNLIIDPSIKDEKRLLTLNFENTSAAIVLKEILDIYDLYYQIEKNVIRITPFQERLFRLNFLDTELTTTFDVGGDVLGAGQVESVSGLSGSFKLSGSGSRQGNTYDLIEDMIKKVMSDQGVYSLNRLSGSLYVKDKPTVIRTITRLINHVKEMLSRQILIDARIIEVSLNDEHKYGINWGVIMDQAQDFTNYTQAAWSQGSGFILNNRSGEFSIDAAIDALNTFGKTRVVSNPSIRSKHGKAAIISVGTSFTYKKSVETTVDTDSQNQTTEVEVSSVFDGLILGVIPFIEEDGRISLLINPIKSDVDRNSLEPESVGAQSDQSISLPEVRIKEISTTIALNTDDVVILGGLIDRRLTDQKKGVPGLASIPVLGYLFKSKLQSEETRELVIILSVSLI
jgi:MSHA type pilus biogenesis protein MshL